MIKPRTSTSVRPDDDPLSAWNDIPSFETDEQRQARLKSEAEAKIISDRIDEELKIEKQKLSKSKGDVKVRTRSQLFPDICSDSLSLRSYFFSDKQSLANQPSRNSSSSCTAQIQWRYAYVSSIPLDRIECAYTRPNALLGVRSSISMSCGRSNKFSIR